MGDFISVDGIWAYSEEFDFGKTDGKIVLKQAGNSIKGIASLTETDLKGCSTFLEEVIEGEIKGNKIIFHGISFQSEDLNFDQTYNLDNWEGYITDESKIVGHTYDQDNICGVFVMTKLSD